MASVDDKSSEVRTKFIVQMQLYVVFLKNGKKYSMFKVCTF